MNYRKGEEKKIRFRTDRCFRVERDWYIATRESQDIGPFDSRKSAEKGVSRYVKYIEQWKKEGVFAQRVALGGIWAANLYV